MTENGVEKEAFNYFLIIQAVFFFRILDSVIMAAVIDPPPKVLPENVTLVFKNMQVYTLLFRYVYLCFNWIGVFWFVCVFVCFMKGKHQ